MIDHQWYYQQHDTSSGPVAWPRLRAMFRIGDLSPETLVREGDQGDWVRACDVPGLCETVGMRVQQSGMYAARGGSLSQRAVAVLSPEDADSTGPWYCQILGEEFGPLSFDQLKAMAESTQLSADDRIRSAEDEEWIPAATLADLWTEHDSLHDSMLATSIAPALAAEPTTREPLPTKAPAVPAKSAVKSPVPAEPGIKSRETVRMAVGGTSRASAASSKTAVEPLILQAVLEISITTAGGPPQQIRAPIRLPMTIGDDPAGIPPVALRLSLDCQADFTSREALAAPAPLVAPAPVVMSPLAAPAVHHVLYAPHQAAVHPGSGLHALPDPQQPEPQDQATGDVWYCQIANREYGPISLEELISWAEQGRIWKQTPIRHGNRGDWFAAGECADLFGAAPSTATATAPSVSAAASTATAPARSSAPATPASSSYSDNPSSAAGALIQSFNRGPRRSTPKVREVVERTPLTELLREHAKPLGIIAGIALLALIWFFPYANRHTALLAEVEQAYSDFQQLRTENADEARWSELQGRLETQFADTVKQLDKTAGPDDPASQHLLWALRDYLPRMLQDGRLKRSKSEDQFEENLNGARNFVHPQPVAAPTEATPATEGSSH